MVETDLALPQWGERAQHRVVGEEDLLPLSIAEKFAKHRMLIIFAPTAEIPQVCELIERG
jgi:hypothetical protein